MPFLKSAAWAVRHRVSGRASFSEAVLDNGGAQREACPNWQTVRQDVLRDAPSSPAEQTVRQSACCLIRPEARGGRA